MSFEVKIPSIGESINEVTVGQWMKEDGEYVERDDVICEIESEKATLEIRAEKDGVLKIIEKEGNTVPIGHKIAEIDTEAEKQGTEEKEQEKAEEEPAEKKGDEGKKKKPEKEVPEGKAEEKGKEVKISPVASRLMSESGLDVGEVKGTGPGGRITKSDVVRAMEAAEKAPVGEKEKASEKEPKGEEVPRGARPAVQRSVSGRKENRSRMSTLRKTVARRMVEAKNQTAMLTTFNELDMSRIIEVRNNYKDLFQKKYELKLGFMSFFVKACC
ncbi:MAG: E3 binding domain-containing protein, partial [Calditrichaeota bacterium]|nr:E3 binding domain-containing protein [Calditrichota bacterium]